MGRRAPAAARRTRWGVRDILYEMGERRPKGAAPWLDPFAAYTIPANAEAPTPVRPRQGRAAWREFAALFLRLPQGGASWPARRQSHHSPCRVGPDRRTERRAGRRATYPFRCVGVRTDMKAKCFEWMDASFDVPPALLDDAGGLLIATALQLAYPVRQGIRGVFAAAFSRTLKQQRYARLRQRMEDEYWLALAEPFRQFVLAVAGADRREAVLSGWVDRSGRPAPPYRAARRRRREPATHASGRRGEASCTAAGEAKKEYVAR